jgi:hypothetical protein
MESFLAREVTEESLVLLKTERATARKEAQELRMYLRRRAVHARARVDRELGPKVF